MTKIFNIILVFSFFNSFFASGQSVFYNFRGVIKDSLTKEVLSFANITIVDSLNQGLTSLQANVKGSFNIDNVAIGKYFLITSYIGYKTQKVFFEIKSTEKTITIPDIYLSLDNINLKEITVKATKPFIVQEIDKIVLNVSESVMANNGNSLDVLRNAPMVRLNEKGDIFLKGKKVIILIDGKNTNAKGESLDAMLNAMPSQSIDKIELISNPSSKYEASGAAIINIKTLKMKSYGTNGVLNIGAGQGVNSRYNTGLSLNFRQQKFNLFGTFNYQNIKRFFKTYTLRDINIENSLGKFEDNEYDLRKNNLFYYKFGFDFDLNSKTTFGLIVNGDKNSRDRTVVANSNFGNSEKLDLNQKINSFGVANFGNANINFNTKHKLNKSSDITFDLDFGNYIVDWKEDIQNTFSKNNEVEGNILSLRTPWAQNVKVASAKTDYKLITSKSTYEVGGQIRQTNTDIDFVFEQKIENVWKQRNSWNSKFKYDENVSALYLNYSGKLKKKVTYQYGLRTEKTLADGLEQITNATVKQNYWNFFPSGAFQYNASDTNQFSVSFSRRITRPRYDQLNSRLIYKSLYFFSQGNVNLKPSFSNSLEFTYTYTPLFSVNLGYTLVQNDMTIVANASENITIYQVRNFKKSELYSLNLNINKQLKKWFLTNTSIQGLYIKNDLNIDGLKNNNGYSAYITTQNYFNINNSIKIDLSGFYQPLYPSGVFISKPWKSVDIGVSKQMFNKKIDARLWLSDVFNSNIQRYSINTNVINIYETYKYESRILRFSLSYKFGNKNFKLKDRKTGIEQESRRIGTGK